jgi:hypothetical protein
MRLLWLYLVLGVALALWCDRKLKDRTPSARATSLLLSVAAWPLWAPIALFAEGERALPGHSPVLLRIQSALSEARRAVEGTSLQNLLPDTLLAQFVSSLQQVERRHAELGQLLSRPEFRVQRGAEVVGARGHHDSVARLHQLKQRDERVLLEMADLAEALRSQLLVARYSGEDEHVGGGVKDMVLDLAARVESMDAWFELDTGSGAVDTAS